MRAAVVSTLEGAMLFGVFHGDLHGGNLFVLPDGRVALLDFGITGRLDEHHRLAFLRLLMGAMMNDVRGEVVALRDLGALRPRRRPRPGDRRPRPRPAAQDVAAISAEELTRQIRELTKHLLAYGAKLPKELMLFVKDILFLDGVVAAFAPDVDLLKEFVEVAGYFATRHGDRIAREIGVDPSPRRGRPRRGAGRNRRLGGDRKDQLPRAPGPPRGGPAQVPARRLTRAPPATRSERKAPPPPAGCLTARPLK